MVQMELDICSTSLVTLRSYEERATEDFSTLYAFLLGEGRLKNFDSFFENTSDVNYGGN
ncbi:MULTISPECIES: hypothetical protein [Aeromonas]|uniref:hypothetical protein n=1 Tax=Aeromonas TaxID=642 RepID=UPI001F195DC3|nr:MULTISPECIES: hypothetical protein [Aeromonas]MCF5901905.1 hypothetical protein [Aeromonas veronii]